MTVARTDPSEEPEPCVAAMVDVPWLVAASPAVVPICGLIVNIFVGLSSVLGIP